jgi:hypothetical protein
MALTIRTFCLVIAAILFAAATLFVPAAPPRFNLMAAGLTFLTLAFLFP